MTYSQLFKMIENELGKDCTDRDTWNAVQQFWRFDRDVTPALVDRVLLLECRMERQHGWKRQPGLFELA